MSDRDISAVTSAAAISRLLAKAGHSRSVIQADPRAPRGTRAPATPGFLVREEWPVVHVGWRCTTAPERAAALADIADTLTDAGYRLKPRLDPDGWPWLVVYAGGRDG